MHLQRCLDQFTELKNVDGQALAHLNLACLLHQMDDSERALSHAHRARELFELLEERGDTHEAAGDRREARELWREALEVFEKIHHPDTERLRAKYKAAV